MIRPVLLAMVALTMAGGSARAQTWRTLDVAAPSDGAPASVRVVYSRGQLQARGADRAGSLYDLHLRYDASRTRPLLTWDSATRALAVGTQAQPDSPARAEGRGSGDAVLQLARDVGIDLDVRLDVATANLDFGGLMLRSLSLIASASEARVRFDTANTTRMERMELDISAATLTASGLANANADSVVVDARAGSAEIDLGGAWTRDMELEIDITLATVTIHVPADVAVELEMTRRMLASVDAGTLRRNGSLYVSGNAATATRKLRIRAGATVGKLKVVHGGR